MLRNVSMVILSIVAAAGMAVVLTLFYRRLRKIDEEQWGDKAEVGGGIMSLFRRRKNRKPKGK